MSRLRRAVLRWTGVLVGLVAAGHPAAGGDAPARELAVVVRGDAVGVRARDVPLDEVLAAVTRATGASLRGRVAAAPGVTVAFEPMPLSEALQRLLGDRSFILRYGQDGRLVAVDLQGGPVVPARPPGLPPAGLGVADLVAAARAHPPVPVDGRLAALFGADRLTLAQLADAALRESDADVRAQAMAAGLRAIETDPTLAAALLASFDGAGQGALASALRTVAGARAEEITAYVAAQAEGPALRARAAVALRGLRAPAGPGG